MSIVKRNQRKLQESVLIGVDLASGKDTTAVMTVNKKDAPRAQAIMEEFDFFKVAMESDLAQLKKFSDIQDKLEYKSQAIENHEYLDYIRRYQAQDANHQNMVLGWVVIWLVDLGRWQAAFELLPLLVKQQQRLPGRFNTQDWPTFFVDQLYDEGAKQLSKGRDAIEQSQVIHQFEQLIELLETHRWQVSELIGGKLYSMAAKLEHTQFNLGNAYGYCLKATTANDKAGVKKLARQIGEAIGKQVSGKETDI